MRSLVVTPHHAHAAVDLCPCQWPPILELPDDSHELRLFLGNWVTRLELLVLGHASQVLDLHPRDVRIGEELEVHRARAALMHLRWCVVWGCEEKVSALFHGNTQTFPGIHDHSQEYADIPRNTRPFPGIRSDSQEFLGNMYYSWESAAIPRDHANFLGIPRKLSPLPGFGGGILTNSHLGIFESQADHISSKACAIEAAPLLHSAALSLNLVPSSL